MPGKLVSGTTTTTTFIAFLLILSLSAMSSSSSYALSASPSSVSSSFSKSSSSSSSLSKSSASASSYSKPISLPTTTRLLSASTPQCSSIQPKEETGVWNLRQKSSTIDGDGNAAIIADGRGVLVGILDTGCDVAAHGLSGKTSDGRRKYLDFVDCTGDGDLDMTTTLAVRKKEDDNKEKKDDVLVKLTKDDEKEDSGGDGTKVGEDENDQKKKKTEDESSNSKKTIVNIIHNEEEDVDTIVGISGRTLKLNPSWSTSLDEIKLSVVRLYQLLPGSVETRLRKERRMDFDRKNGIVLAYLQSQIDALENGYNINDNDHNDTEKTMTKKERDDLKKDLSIRMEEIETATESYVDDGPYMDVLLFRSSYHRSDEITSDGNVDNIGTGEEKWHAIIDVNANGDLTKSEPLTPFGSSGLYGTLGYGSALTYCIQVYDDGDVLNIVTDAGSHGTHVAGIVAAHYPTEEENNNNNNDDSDVIDNINDNDGVAPGAQILALKIGDGRLGSAETGTGLIRALIHAKNRGCDVVNLSFGEPAWEDRDSGEVAKMFQKAVRDWNVIVFTSAGNDGPALSTLGSPGTLTDVITVGAYVSGPMMKDMYSTLPPPMLSSENDSDKGLLPGGSSYDFTSRGPTPDGHYPDICAPGGAIAPVPRHTLQGRSRYHGTSMASPNACGAAACILSVLKQDKNGENQEGLGKKKSSTSAKVLPPFIRPIELKRALMNTALSTSSSTFNYEPYSMGAGLINVSAAAEQILARKNRKIESSSTTTAIDADRVDFDVTVQSLSTPGGRARGIYLRDGGSSSGGGESTTTSHHVSVTPKLEHSTSMRTVGEVDESVSFDVSMRLGVVVTDSSSSSSLPATSSWVTCPDIVRMSSMMERGGGYGFDVRVDTKGLTPGLHHAWICGYEDNKNSSGGDPDANPLFRLPVTVIVPHAVVHIPGSEGGTKGAVVDGSTTTLRTASNVPLRFSRELLPAVPERIFVVPPPGAEWAVVKVRSNSENGNNRSNDDSSKSPLVNVHVVPFVGGDLPNGHVQVRSMRRIRPDTEQSYKIRVRGRSTVEICLQLSWLTDPTPANVEVDVNFHSYDVRSPSLWSGPSSSQGLIVRSDVSFGRVELCTGLGSEKIKPKCTLKNVRRTVLPSKVSVKSLLGKGSSSDSGNDGWGGRDVIPPTDAEVIAAASVDRPPPVGKVTYQATVQYSFEVGCGDSEDVNVLPRIGPLFNQIYDSPIESHMWMLRDSNGKVLRYGGAIHDTSPVKLGKGTYEVDVSLRHTDRAFLEEFSAGLPLGLHIDLPSSLDCPVYGRMSDASVSPVGGGGVGKKKEKKTKNATTDNLKSRIVKMGWMTRGERRMLYVARPTEGLPTWVGGGDVLEGSFAINEDDAAVTSLGLSYEVAQSDSGGDNKGIKKEEEVDDDDDDDDEKDDNGEVVSKALKRALFEAKLKHLKKLRADGKNKKRKEDKVVSLYERLATELRSEKPDSLPLLIEILKNAMTMTSLDNKDVSDDGAKSSTSTDKDNVTKVNDSRQKMTEITSIVQSFFVERGGPINETSLAAYYGCNHPEEEEDMEEDKGEGTEGEEESSSETMKKSKEVKKIKKENDEARKALRLALLYSAATLVDVSVVEKEETGEISSLYMKELDNAIRKLKVWISGPKDFTGNDEKKLLAVTLVKYEIVKGRVGVALVTIRKAMEGCPKSSSMDKELLEEMKAMYELMNDGNKKNGDMMDHWVKNVEERLFASFPVLKQKL